MPSAKCNQDVIGSSHLIPIKFALFFVCLIIVSFPATNEHGPCIYLHGDAVLFNGSCEGLCLLVGIFADAASATFQSVFWCFISVLQGIIYLTVYSKDLKNCTLS